MTQLGKAASVRADLRLADRFEATDGSALLTGVQAVCRVPIDVRRADNRRGLNTRAFVSGYQGSPLGTLDFTMRPIAELLQEHGVDFRPGLNEALAATAVLGTQAVPNLGSKLDGVAGFWYGKAPGVDQALDPIRHGNLIGTHHHGGALAICGDDPTAKSSTVPCGSETVLRAALLPTLVAADTQDVLDFGLHGIAMSRASGTWVALKIATNVADGSSVVDLHVDSFEPIIPLLDGRLYEHTVNTRLAAQVAEHMERNLHQVRLPLALEYARLNGLNRITQRGAADSIGIIAAGHPYLEARQALADLGLVDNLALEHAGIRLLRIGMVWPLETQIIRDFADGLEEVVVVEDKGPFLEQMVKDALYNAPRRPRVVGVYDENGEPLLPSYGSVDADAIGEVLAPRILKRQEIASVRARLVALQAPRRQTLSLSLAPRTPYFCSGCPHNSSTKSPDGALIGGGIGCHAMSVFMDTDQVGTVTGLTQMGGEGAQWIGQQPYVDANHTFQNLGDGTLAHSGLLAIRASIAAGTNITYKILYNSTVAMTGGQDAVGGYTVPSLTATLAAEGVKKIIVTSDHPENYRGVALPKIATVRDRSAMLDAQNELRVLSGTTVLIHDQACAAELRRKRKRGLVEDPPLRVVINERICEGCGDCGKKSNCLSVIPVQTAFGRKTQIHQSSCNKDYSCLAGDCPSFMTITPAIPAGTLWRSLPPLAGDQMPPPSALFDQDGFSLRITGIGGTGVVTVAQILATAGFVEGLYPHGLDQVGLSQKAGPVVSDVRFATDARPMAPKLTTDSCDLYLGCDIVVAADAKHLRSTNSARTVAIVSTTDVPSGSMVRNPSTAFADPSRLSGAIDAATNARHNVYLDASKLAETLFGSDQLANMILVGAAFQSGALPLRFHAIEKAIELNGVAVESNLQAFRRGRQAIADSEALAEALAAESPAPSVAVPDRGVTDLIDRSPFTASDAELRSVLELRVADLIAYQNERYAGRYLNLVARAQRAEDALDLKSSGKFTAAVAIGLHKLMAYKDEYEVARLALDPTERAKITAEFGQGAKVAWRLHPPLLRSLGMKNKLSLGRWFLPVFIVLRALRRVRGTKLDLFGYAEVRRVERRLVREYSEIIDEVSSSLTSESHRVAVQIAELPDLVRGYEHIKLTNVEKYQSQMSLLRRKLLGVE